MDYLKEKSAAADAQVGSVISPEVFKAFFAESASQNPRLKQSLHQFMRNSGISKGKPVRVRADYKYSRVGISFDGVGALQGTDPPALYSQKIGDTDPVLGILDTVDTNQLQGNRQDSASMFRAYKHGFTIELVNNPSLALSNDLATAAQQILQNTAASFDVGTQTNQRWPPLRCMPGVITAFSTGGTIATAAGAPQGNQMLMPLNPCVDFGAGTAYRIELKIKRVIAGVNAISTNVLLANADFAITHCFYGKSFTGIPG